MAAGMILTNQGRNLLGTALTGKPLIFTRAFVGTGDLGSRNPASMTDLVARKMELPITAIRTSSVGTAEITVEITNEKISQGFFMKEYGVFARNAESQTDYLYSYCNKGNEAGYLEGFDGTNPVHFTLSFINVIDQAQNVTATISGTYNYVTQSNLDFRIESLFTNGGTPAGFFAYGANDTRRLRPLDLEETRRQLIGTYDMAALAGRVTALENALHDVTLSLNLQEIYPNADRYIAEDFVQPDTVDLYEAPVTSILAGDDSIDVDPLEGLIPGSWYTISDGSRSEKVQVESISLENGIMRVVLYDVIQNTYNLANCRIFRTTADIHAGNANGTGTKLPVTWMPAVTWKGISQGSSFTAMLDTSVSAQKNFTFSGLGTITADGALTLGE